MKQQEQLHDTFLKSLIKSDGLMKPSYDFTAKLMAKLPFEHKLAQEPSPFIGRNLTLLIFLLVAFINFIVLYLIWPYLSVWLPENSIVLFILDQAELLIRSHFATIINRSATISMVLVIGLGTTTLIGREEITHLFFKQNNKTKAA